MSQVQASASGTATKLKIAFSCLDTFAEQRDWESWIECCQAVYQLQDQLDEEQQDHSWAAVCMYCRRNCTQHLPGCPNEGSW